MLAGIPQKRVEESQHGSESCERAAGSAVRAVRPVSAFCAPAVSGGCHSQTVYLSSCWENQNSSVSQRRRFLKIVSWAQAGWHCHPSLGLAGSTEHSQLLLFHPCSLLTQGTFSLFPGAFWLRCLSPLLGLSCLRVQSCWTCNSSLWVCRVQCHNGLGASLHFPKQILQPSSSFPVHTPSWSETPQQADNCCSSSVSADQTMEGGV